MFYRYLLGTAMAALTAVGVANAGPLMMFVDDGAGNTALITDNMAGDSDAGAGSISANLSTLFGGASWVVGKVATGTSNSLLPLGGFAHLGTVVDLSDTSGAGTTGGTLTVRVSDVGFMVPSPNVNVVQDFSLTSVGPGATTGGTYAAFQNNSNAGLTGAGALPGGGTLLQSGSWNDAGDDAGPLNFPLFGVTIPYSIYHEIVVTQAAVAAGIAYQNNPTLTTDLFIPEPASMTLLGAGLAGLGLLARRRRKAA